MAWRATGPEAHSSPGIPAAILAAPSQRFEDLFLARYDGDGDQLWIIQFGTTGSDRLLAAASDGAGGVLLTGQTGGALGGAPSGWTDAFLVRCRQDRNIEWITQFGTPGVRDVGTAIALDDAGGMFVAGGAFPRHPDDGQAWLARFPLEAGCYADCDGSGALDLLDLVCFQGLFAARAPRADCDLSGSLDFFDFLCFQNGFVAGCR